MPGVITCGVGLGDGLGLVVLLAGVRRARVVVLFFAGRFAAGFRFAAGGFGITCPSCCGNAVLLNPNINATAHNARRRFLQSPNQIMFPPKIQFAMSEPQMYV